MITTALTAIAKLYLSYMLCVLPASKETKRPTVAWKSYQDALPTESQWDEWGSSATALCIITGRASGFLLVMDFDDKGSRYQPWCQLLPQELLDRLLVVQTPSGGNHVYVRCEGEVMGNVKLARTAEGKTLIETRGEGGLVIAPPTLGYSVIAGTLENIPVVSPAELELLRNAAQSFDEMPEKATSKNISNTTIAIQVDMTEAMRLAIVQAETMPPAIEGCNGSADAMRFANVLYELGLDWDAAVYVFMEYYNPRCIPEWSEKEVEHKLDTAYNKPLREAGCMLAKPTTPDFELHPKLPLRSAQKFIEHCYTFNGIPTLIFYADDFWQWDGNAYRKIEDRKVKNRLLRFLDWAASFPAAPANLNAVIEMVKNEFYQSASETVPCWIGGEACEMPSSVTDLSQLLFCKSQILNLADMGTLPHTPHWLNLAALDFDYDPNAECPQWRAFLDSIFGDDEGAKRTLMEWMGLCLTAITKFQKALFLIGPKRSGKGTFSRILQKVVGAHNVVSPSTADFGQQFGLQAFIGKTLAVVSDARFPRGIPASVAERLLTITGEDPITIPRKYREALTTRLQTKIMIISNEVPIVDDPSGALASRFVFLKLTKSFYGNEDVELEGKLSSELSGIFRFAIKHLQDLLKRGDFIQPESGKGLAERMTALSSPVGEFAKQLRQLMTKDAIWDEWMAFCLREAMPPGRQNVLWRDLEAAGYNCDFDAADILAKIRQRGGEATVQDFRNGIARFHTEGGTALLKRKLVGMVKAGLLSVREAKAGNGQPVEYYSITDAVLDEPCNDDD